MKKIIVFLLLCSVVFAQDTLRAYVTDNANVLSAIEKQQLTEVIRSMEQSTTVEIAIVTVQSLEGTTIEDYAVETFAKSGIGKKDIDNGLLIVLAPNDRQYRLEVGYGLEGVIPDIVARQIGVKVMEPLFKEGKYGAGLLEGVKTINAYVQGNPEVVSAFSTKQNPKSSSYYFIVLIIIFIIISSLSRRAGPMIFVPGFGGGMRGGGFGGFGGGMSGGGGFSGRF